MGERIEISTKDGTAEAYLTGERGKPGVLFFVDAIGLRPQTQEMADRIASWGYTVLVPHVFYRDGSADELAPKGDLREEGAREEFFSGGVMDRVGALTPDRSEPDSDAWIATLREHAGSGPMGAVGYCMGARLAVRAAGRFDDPETGVVAVGGFHGGGLVTDESTSPHFAIAGSHAAYAFGHADNDGSMPPEAQHALEQALEAADRPYEADVYPGAQHGYTMADTSMYDEAGAERHFSVLRELFGGALTTG